MARPVRKKAPLHDTTLQRSLTRLKTLHDARPVAPRGRHPLVVWMQQKTMDAAIGALHLVVLTLESARLVNRQTIPGLLVQLALGVLAALMAAVALVIVAVLFVLSMFAAVIGGLLGLVRPGDKAGDKAGDKGHGGRSGTPPPRKLADGRAARTGKGAAKEASKASQKSASAQAPLGHAWPLAGQLVQRTSRLHDFLARRDVTLVGASPQHRETPELDRVATYMGEHSRDLRFLYKELRPAATSPDRPDRTFFFPLHDVRADVADRIVALLHELESLGVLTVTSVERHVSNPHVEGVLDGDHDDSFFIVGGWFERYALYVLLKALESKRQLGRASYLQNVRIQLPDGGDAELDLLFEIDGEVWWAEVKTGGDFDASVSRYERIRRVLGLGNARACLVLPGIGAERASELEARSGLTVCGVSDFATHVQHAIDKRKAVG